MTSKQATPAQVRHFYKDQGYEVRITKDGHVSFRYPFNDALWKDGRFVSEYRVDDGQVHLT